MAQETILTPVAVDHGFSHIKTASEIFPTAIAKVDIPITSENILQIGEDYYRVGGRRIDVLEDKTQTESFKLLTYVAIAKHLEARNVKKAHGDPWGRSAYRKACQRERVIPKVSIESQGSEVSFFREGLSHYG